MMGADELDVFLIEDNPGDARLIEEMLRDAEELLRRVDAGLATGRGSQIYHESRLSDGIDRLSETDVDVILLDLGLPESTGLDTLATVVDATEFVPIVVLTGLRDEQVGIEAIQRGAQDYLVKDEVTSDLLVRTIHHAIERTRQERERVRRREQLEALNRLNRIAQDVSHAVITADTQEELERAVCERLVESDAYRFAWIGHVNRASDQVTPQTAAGAEEGYLDEITITVGEGDEAQGRTARAIQTHEVQVMQSVQTAPEYEPWREEALERGYRSSAAIPIVYENVVYGVLNVYAASPEAFSDPETEILSRLGDVVGHAITAIERMDALVSDTVLEFEFQVGGVFGELVGLSADEGATVEFQNMIQGDEALIAYGRAEELPEERFHEVAEQTATIEGLRVLTTERDGYDFELVTTTAMSLVRAVATHGGQVTAARIEDGEFRFVVEFPPGGDKRQLVELVSDHCEGASPHAQRTVERSGRDGSSSRSVLQDNLTDKQRAALETAYYAGFFDWPRTSTGQEIADRLGVTPSTFSQHLRAAERKFFDAVFGGNDSE
ncbi:diguanylate cyclase [Halobacteriales archaeon QS_1_68_20]|nr:MAG: diguanylate cyclase [Halobacteriales archaeon QS_1_68_20]